MALILLPAGGAAAQDQPKPAAEKPKTPPPPLFPRHRRGLYRNAAGVEVIDATPQSPPLDTDDPGVPDNGEFELNFSTHFDYAKEAQHIDLLTVDANYGILPVIAGYKLPSQIKIEIPMSSAREAGEPYNTGLGAAKFGIKVNFYRDEHRGISVSFYPQVEFAADGGRGARKNLEENGQTLILPLLVAREFHQLTFVVNGTFEKPFNDPDRGAASEFGVGFGRALTRKVAAMIELRTESSLDFKDDRLVFINAGIIHGVRNIVVYFNGGHSVLSGDGRGHTYAGIGIKLLIGTKDKQ